MKTFNLVCSLLAFSGFGIMSFVYPPADAPFTSVASTALVLAMLASFIRVISDFHSLLD